MTTYEERIHHGQQFETQLLHTLNNNGIHAEPWGRAALTKPLRDKIPTTATRIRWQPDIIAIHGGRTIFIDAKNSDPTQTGRHAVETQATHENLRWQTYTLCPVIYAFPHTTGISLVPLDRWINHKRPGPQPKNGSGTPYDLAECNQICRHTLTRNT